MKDNRSDIKLIISIIVVFVVVVAIIAYVMTHTAGPGGAPQAPAGDATGTDKTETPITNPKTNNPTKPMSALEKGKAFLTENAKKEGVVTLPSGLQYKVLVAGNGPKPTANQTVKVNYEGTLIDGTVFDSSYRRGEPIEFGVTQVIPGWVEGLQLMPVGSTWMLYIPSNLAYGEYGAGGAIGPNETLIFKVELIAAH